jgi:hypothetical protein
MLPLLVVIIYEIYHYYYISSCLDILSLFIITPIKLSKKKILYYQVKLSDEEILNIKGYLKQKLSLFLKKLSLPLIYT